MTRVFKSIFKLFLTNDDYASMLLRAPRSGDMTDRLTQRELIQQESLLGQSIFGVPSADIIRRDFFNLDEKTWIWHEVKRGAGDVTIETTTRYEIKPTGVLKVLPGSQYVYIEGAELQNFMRAVRHYYERIAVNIYKIDPYKGG